MKQGGCTLEDKGKTPCLTLMLGFNGQLSFLTVVLGYEFVPWW